MITAVESVSAPSLRLPRSFDEWRSRVMAQRMPPVIAVAGSRGKTIVVRLLDAIFHEAGLRTALWTDRGVELNGRHQRGELVPWSRGLGRLVEGRLDVAVQELDWATVHAVGLPDAVYPIVAVTNLCVNSDSCLVQEDTRLAFRALERVRAAVHPTGVLVLNGEDFAVGEQRGPSASATLLVGVSPDTPLVRSHLRAGGTAAWAKDGELWVGDADTAVQIGPVRELRHTLDGAVGFQVHNSLTAAAVALACGVSTSTVSRALAGFAVPPTLMPGSFNVLAIAGATAVVERPAPSWFLRPALRALFRLPSRRLLTVAGMMEPVPDSDLTEVGRLLGRNGGALILHGAELNPERAAQIRQGIATNEVPPMVLHVGTERQAVGRALQMVGPDDLLLILAEQPAAVLRALERARNRLGDG